MSKDSASPSSVEPEVVSALDPEKMRGKINKYIKENFWTRDIQNEEEPEVQHPEVKPMTPEHSEIFDYSKDSGMNEAKNIGEISINSSSLDLDILNRADNSQKHQDVSEESFLDKSGTAKEAYST